MVEAALTLCRWLHYAAVTGLFGLAFFVLYAPATVIGRAPPAGALRGLAGIALISGLAWLYLLAGSVGGGLDQAWSTLPLLITGADFGRIWLARMALALMICLPLRRSARMTAFLAALLLASIALTGHARTHDGMLGALQVVGDGLHLLAAGAWIGALAGFLVLLRRAPDDAQTTRALSGFSGLGMTCVAILLVTGALNAWLILEGPAALISTLYGRLLLAKVAMFAAMIGFAAHNRLKLVPALEAAPSPALIAHLRRNVMGEQTLALAVLLIVGVIGAMDPGA